MLPDRVSNPGPLTYESGALPIALRGPAFQMSTYRNIAYTLMHIFSLLTRMRRFSIIHQKLQGKLISKFWDIKWRRTDKLRDKT